MTDVGGSSSSRSATADDLGSAQQDSVDPGVDTIDLLDDVDEEAGSTVRYTLLVVFVFTHVLQ